jgi:MoxR-like ATPase
MSTELSEIETQPEISAVDAIAAISEGKERIMHEVRKVIVGQTQVVEDVVTSFFAGGHCLITGVPGLAKTLLISSLGRALDLKFRRVQFTPDLMPADITGTEVLEEDRTTGSRNMKFRPGPVFTNILLADEINRTPPKTRKIQSSRKAPIRCPRFSRIGSCSALSSIIFRRTKNSRWSTPRRA